jgi:hypothetical protein
MQFFSPWEGLEYLFVLLVLHYELRSFLLDSAGFCCYFGAPGIVDSGATYRCLCAVAAVCMPERRIWCLSVISCLRSCAGG